MKILVVEDDRKIAAFVASGLAQEGFVVEHAFDGLDGLQFAMTNSYAAMIVDLMLPKLDGFSLIERMRYAKIKTPVLILSAKQSVGDKVQGLQIGGDDFLTKPFAFSELLARLQSIIRRSAGTPEATRLTVADLSMDLIRREVKRGEARIELQPREFALLEFLMRNSGRVVSKAMIVEHVWDYNFDPQTNVVEARISRLRDKVDKNSEVKLIHTIRGVGYVLREE